MSVTSLAQKTLCATDSPVRASAEKDSLERGVTSVQSTTTTTPLDVQVCLNEETV